MAGKDEKNWLIRTKNFQILGPVSKRKVIEFVEKGSLKADDEISCGNGYWFAIGEKDLLDKYVYGDVPQEFNPISEAPTVLATEENLGHTASFGGGGMAQASQQAKELSEKDSEVEPADQDGDGQKFPGDENLDYPDPRDDITVVSGANDLMEKLEQENQKEAEASGPPPIQGEIDESPSHEGDGLVPDEQDLEYPDIPSGGEDVQSSESPSKSSSFDSDKDGASEASLPPEVLQEGDEEVLVPAGDDLEYPDIPGQSEEGSPESFPGDEGEKESRVTGEDQGESRDELNSKAVEKSHKAQTDITANDDLDEMDINLPATDKKEEKEGDTAPDVTHKGVPKKVKGKKKGKVDKKDRNDRYLLYLFVLLALLVGGIVYYYLKILNKPLPLVGTAHAQTIESVGKKKV